MRLNFEWHLCDGRLKPLDAGLNIIAIISGIYCAREAVGISDGASITDLTGCKPMISGLAGIVLNTIIKREKYSSFQSSFPLVILILFILTISCKLSLVF